jgi:undecaprenyl-diphosphatase
VSSARFRLASAIVVLAGIWLAMLIGGGGPLDRAIYDGLYAGGHPALLAIARLFTALGQPATLIAGGFVIAGLLWWRSRGRLAVALLGVILVGRALASVQKYWIARVRPDVEPHLVVVHSSSFPSGHATSSMIVFLALALALTARTRWHRLAAGGAVLLSLLVGTSRVMLGVHWPSDVAGGWAFGALWVLLTLPLAERLFRVRSV